ncbi:AAR2 protein-domain-containing protein [Geopyxis carbonaria]|nr:AAR2 protein-domain-containing protein [Geopyxis carbonaria]
MPPTTTLHLTSIPVHSHLGLDLSSFTVPAHFTGITALPLGLHHIWLSPAPSLVLRSGLWFHITADTPSNLYYTYDAATEILVPDQNGGTTVVRGGSAAGEKDGMLSYRQRSLTTGSESTSDSEWRALTASITPAVLTTLLGPVWRVGSISESTSSNTAADAKEATILDAIPLRPDADAKPEYAITFTPIDLARSWPEGALGRERTLAARDKSWALHAALSRWGDEKHGGEQLLGEWQVAFVLGVLLGNWAACEQWRRINGLFLGARSAAVDPTLSGVFCSFLAGLRQMVEALAGGVVGDGGFLGDEDLAGVEKGMRRFATALREDGGAKGKVGNSVKDWVKWGRERMEWSIDTREVLRRGTVMTEEGDVVEVQEDGLEEEEESGEYAPVVVEISESPPKSPVRPPVERRSESPPPLERSSESPPPLEKRSESPELVIELAGAEDDDDPRY